MSLPRVTSHPLRQTMELPDGLTEPNAGAYTKTETREGPPLDYVAEKLRSSLEVLHTLYLAAAQDLPDDLPVPKRFQAAKLAYDVKTGSVLNPCQDAFRLGLTAYLALNNLLGIANDQGIFGRLLAMPHDEFANWLRRITEEGSVT